MYANVTNIAEHVSKDDPKTTFAFDEIQEGTAIRWEVGCFKDRADGDQDVHWLVSFTDKDKAQAEFDRWANS